VCVQSFRFVLVNLRFNILEARRSAIRLVDRFYLLNPRAPAHTSEKWDSVPIFQITYITAANQNT